MNNVVFNFKSLTAGYHNQQILKNFSLDLQKQELVAILGPNGSGKSTIINSIFGLTKIFAGEIFFEGANLTNFEPKILTKNIAAVPQIASISYNFLAKDFLKFGILPIQNILSRYELIEIEQQTDFIIDFFDLKCILKKPILELSSGEFQRLLISQNLIKNPKIIFLDEPLSHLDIKFQLQILNFLTNLKKKNITIVMVIHDLHLAYKFFDRFIFLKLGETHSDLRKKDSNTQIFKKIIKEVYEIEETQNDFFY